MKWEKFIQAGIRLPYYMNLYIVGKHTESAKIGAWKNNHWLSQSDKQLTTVYFDPEEINLAGEWLKRRVEDLSSLKKFQNSVVMIENRLRFFSRRLSFTDFSKLPNEKLTEILNYFSSLFQATFGIYSFPKLIDSAFVAKSEEILGIKIHSEDYIKLMGSDELSEYQKERLEYLQMISQIKDSGLEQVFTQKIPDIIEQTGRFYPDIYHALERHARKFIWINASHHMQPANIDHVIAGVSESLTDITLADELEKILNHKNKVLEQRRQIIEKHKFDAQQIQIINFLRFINFYNEHRKSGMSKSILWSYPLFIAIAERLNTDIISLRQLTNSEIVSSLLEGSLTENKKTVIKQRLKYYVCLLADGKIYQAQGEKTQKYFDSHFSQAQEDIKELKGQTAFPGFAKGRVRLILMEHQANNLQPGEILISSMTDPNMLPAMKKAAAIVTDEGGTLCHAAIVARELKKPCVIGTKIATKIFKDGDEVEVDADNGVFKKLREITTK